MTDTELERAIDDAGRAAVFERARRLGWSPDNPPPAWVWASIASDVKAGRPSGMPPERLDEAILGFRLF
jgi:hypothetical protein